MNTSVRTDLMTGMKTIQWGICAVLATLALGCDDAPGSENDAAAEPADMAVDAQLDANTGGGPELDGGDVTPDSAGGPEVGPDSNPTDGDPTDDIGNDDGLVDAVVDVSNDDGGIDAQPDVPSPCTPESTRPCGLQVGECEPGVETCDDSGEWSGECVGATLPDDEICDGRDNDCDGAVDEDNPSGENECDTGEPGICTDGTTACVDGEVRCVRNHSPEAEICDGLDNDCDGQTDQGNPEGGEQCDTGVPGICARGRSRCVDTDVVCEGITAPGLEFCDGLDNDCNGETDEGSPGTGFPCETPESGVCSAGSTVCRDGSVQCVRDTEPSNELCDGLDNDCDGEIDEGNAIVGVECDTDREGVCATGRTSCAGGVLNCNPVAEPDNEICDGLDNDCDGETDEGAPGVGDVCETDEPGVCGPGTTQCDAAGNIVCARDVEPSEEVCDNLDNDCNGEIDEAREICDGIDNNCDGQIDEDDPDMGLACDSGQAGLCSPGQITCIEGLLICTPVVVSTYEICDDLDNDCDGIIDEAPIKPGGDLRVSNAPGEAKMATLTTVGDGYGVAWVEPRAGDLRQLYFARLSADGEKIIDDVALTDVGGAPPGRADPTITWTGSEFGVAWVDNRNGLFPDIYFGRYNDQGGLLPRPDPANPGQEIVEVIRVTPDRAPDPPVNAGHPSLVWTGSFYGLVWSDSRNQEVVQNIEDVFFARITSDGDLVDSENIQITLSEGRAFTPSVTWRPPRGVEPGEFAAVWLDLSRPDGSGVYFTRFSQNGERLLPEDVLVATTGGWPRPSLVWTGSEYAIAWSSDETDSREIFFARLDDEGNIIGADVRITRNDGGAFEPTLVWTGSEYGVSWYDTRDGNREIYFTRISANGVKLGDDIRITHDNAPSSSPHMKWNGIDYALVWADGRAARGEPVADMEIFFTRGSVFCR